MLPSEVWHFTSRLETYRNRKLSINLDPETAAFANQPLSRLKSLLKRSHDRRRIQKSCNSLKKFALRTLDSSFCVLGFKWQFPQPTGISRFSKNGITDRIDTTGLTESRDIAPNASYRCNISPPERLDQIIAVKRRCHLSLSVIRVSRFILKERRLVMKRKSNLSLRLSTQHDENASNRGHTRT